MRTSSLLIVATLLGCAGPTGIMADTDESSSGSSGTDGTDATTNMTTTSPTTTTASTTMTTDPSTTMTTDPSTTMPDPDSSTTDDPTDATTDGETGECIPGTVDCPCDIGSTCEDDLVCEDGTCVADPGCEEPEGEPNDDEASAVELPDVTCGADAMTAMGGFDGAETDWFVYHAEDAIACFESPDIEITADVDVAACAFLSCDSGNESVTCQNGADDDTSPDGLPGCCDQGGVSFDFNCQLGAANGSIFVRLVSLDAACVPYEIAFDY